MIDRPERQHDQPRHPGPRFSIVVPTYERPAQLAACLAALRALERPGGSIEIVVVNDGGTALGPLDAGGPDPGLAIRVLDQPNAGPAAARNAALVVLSQIATATGALREWLVPTGRWVAPARTGEHRTPHPSSVPS